LSTSRRLYIFVSWSVSLWNSSHNSLSVQRYNFVLIFVCRNFGNSCNSCDSHNFLILVILVILVIVLISPNSCNSKYTLNTCFYIYIYIYFSAQQLLFWVLEVYDYILAFVLPPCRLTFYYCQIYYRLHNKSTCNYLCILYSLL